MDSLYEIAKYVVVMVSFYMILGLCINGIFYAIRGGFRWCRKKWKAWRHPEGADAAAEKE